MAKVKYMGSAHVRLIEAGENFGGRLATPLAETLRWDKNNDWILDTDEAGLSEEAVELLLSGNNFQDVTGLERVPVNQHQSIFYGMTDSDQKAEEPAVAEVSENPAPRGGRISEPENQEVQ